MRVRDRILVLGLCAIMLYVASGCEQSQKEYLADYRARQATDEIDNKIFLTLSEREILYGDLRKYFEEIYVNDCDLR